MRQKKRELDLTEYGRTKFYTFLNFTGKEFSNCL